VSNLIQVNLVAADREIWSGEASMVIAKTSEGEIGLLAGHEPMLAILIPGSIRVTTADGGKVVARLKLADSYRWSTTP